MLCINPLLHNTIFREMGRLQSEAGGWLQGSLSTGHSNFLYICCANSIDVLNLINFFFFINSGLNYWENPPSRSLSCKRQAQFSHRNQQSKICSQKISRPSLGPSRLRTRLTGLFMALDMFRADNHQLAHSWIHNLTTVRKSWDYISWIWQYKVLNIKMSIWGKNN